MADVAKLKERSQQLAADKTIHEQVWFDCFEWTYPERGDGLMSNIISGTDAQQRKARILDSTAGDSVNTAAATLINGMVPSNARWFALDVGNESDEERRWLDDCAQFMWENIHASNFDAEVFDFSIDVMCAGWSVLYCEEGEEGGFYFECWPLGQCRIGSSRSASRVDTIVRCWEWTVSQTVAEYGIDKVSESTRQAWYAQKYSDKVQLCHQIQPRELYAVGGKTAKNMPFQSCHYEEKNNHLLRESGYNEFPVMVPRWMRLPNSVYATGPMSKALPDVRTLNEMVRFQLMGAETVLAPPLIAADDGVLNAKNIKIGPRKIIVANSVDSIKPLLTGARIDWGQLEIGRLQGAIRRIMMADQLPPADGPVKTAYEWSIRVETLRKILGPVFGRFQAEFLQPLVERAFGIVWRSNEASGFSLVGRPPASLLNRNFSVRYLSPLAKAQRLEDVAGMDRFEATLIQTATATQDPSVLDLYDFDGAERERAKFLGIPQRLVRDEKTVDGIRKQRAKAQQQAQDQAMQQAQQQEVATAQAKAVAAA